MHRYDVRNKSRSNKSHADISLLAHAHSLVKLVTATRRMLPVSQKLMPKSNACLMNAGLCPSFKAHYCSSFDAANWQTLRCLAN